VISLVLPLYNEADGVRATVASLTAALGGAGLAYELVLVNNGSTDDTAAVLREIEAAYPTVRVAHVAVNDGYGWGILCGLREAKGDVIGFMCGDGQIADEDVVRVCRRMLDENLDLCKVSRVVRRDGPQRRVMSAVYNAFFRLLFGGHYADINGTPKLMRRTRYERLDLKSRDWFIDAELMIAAARERWRVGEVAVTFTAREQGSSNVRLTTSFEFVRNMLRYRLRGR
jgi:glycosyltransferase involved in cell wall biosynthesis